MTSATTRTGPTVERIETLVAASLVVAAAGVALLLMLARLRDPFGGYLAFNEAWYALLAQHYSETGAWLTPQVTSNCVSGL